MFYQIQRQSLHDERWITLDNTGKDLQVMQASVDELLVTAELHQTGERYRLVDAEQQVIYAPSEQDIGWPAHRKSQSGNETWQVRDNGK